MKEFICSLSIAVWWIVYGVLKIVDFFVNLISWPLPAMKRNPVRSAIVCLLMVFVIGFGINRYYRAIRQSFVCAQNLQAIYQALTDYQKDNGHLPQRLGDLCPKYLKSDDPVWMCPASDYYFNVEICGIKTNYWYFLYPDIKKRHCLTSELGDETIVRCFAVHNEGQMHLRADGAILATP